MVMMMMTSHLYPRAELYPRSVLNLCTDVLLLIIIKKEIEMKITRERRIDIIYIGNVL